MLEMYLGILIEKLEGNNKKREKLISFHLTLINQELKPISGFI